jgi:hypothetical protein
MKEIVDDAGGLIGEFITTLLNLFILPMLSIME